MNTELGRIAGLMKEAGAEEKTPLQRKLDAFGRILVWAPLGIVVLLLVAVVLASIGLQVWSQHDATLGRLLKTSHRPLTHGLCLLAIGAIPLVVLEMVKLGEGRDTPHRRKGPAKIFYACWIRQ